MKIRTIIVSLLIIALIIGSTGIASAYHGPDCTRDHPHDGTGNGAISGDGDGRPCDRDHPHPHDGTGDGAP